MERARSASECVELRRERRSEQLADVGAERVESVRRQWVAIEQSDHEGDVAEIAEQCAVARHQEELGILAPEHTSLHATLEVGDRAQEDRTKRRADVDAEVILAVEGLTTDHPHEVGVVLEEA